MCLCDSLQELGGNVGMFSVKASDTVAGEAKAVLLCMLLYAP